MVIFIAGVNQGLGLVLSEYMAEKGHTVFAGYRNVPSAEVKAAAQKYSHYKPLRLDVTSEEQAAEGAKEIAAQGIKLDGAVIVAGVLMDSDRERLITDVDIQDLRTALEVHVVGSAIILKHFSSLMQPGGTFLIITSEGGSMTNIGAKYPAYSITKAAQNKLTAIFSKTITDYKVYAVHPGRMNTIMGRNDAQIEPIVSAEGIYNILTGEKKIPPEKGWFINYLGEAMNI